MIDPDRWQRLAFDLHTACTDEDPNLDRAERRAVYEFTALHRRITQQHLDNQTGRRL